MSADMRRALDDVERRARENASRFYWDSLSARAQQDYRLAAASELEADRG